MDDSICLDELAFRQDVAGRTLEVCKTSRSDNSSTDDAIDRDHLAKYTFGNRDLEDEILVLFAEQAMKLFDQLSGAGSQPDWAFATHSLKGSARAVGAWKVAQSAERLEQLGYSAATAQAELTVLGARLDQAVAAATSPRVR